MNAYADKTGNKKEQAAANISSPKQNGSEDHANTSDRLPGAGEQGEYQVMADASARVSQLRGYQEMANQGLQAKSPAQRKVAGNNTFLANQLASVVQKQPADIQGAQVVQRELDDDELEEWWDMPEKDWAHFEDSEKEQLGKYRAKKLKERALAETIKAALASIKGSGSYKTWTYDGESYHLNFKYGTSHVTWESTSRMHYFFKGSGEGITDEQPKQGERGQHAYVFTELPPDVQTFIKTHFLDLI